MKRWRYVGAFGERLMLCAATVRIGVLHQGFWAVWDRERGALRERTRLWRPARFVEVPHGRVWVDDGSVSMDLLVEGAEPVETASPHGPSWIWTRKQGGARVHGRVVLDGEVVEVDALGCVDESAGYHARETAWEWSAGVGSTVDGRAVAWNLVVGVHDAAQASERSLWVDGVASHVAPVEFLPGQAGIAFAEGSALAFTPEAERRRRDELLLLASDYACPFGTFAGTLPGGLELASGRGVMERHTARW